MSADCQHVMLDYGRLCEDLAGSRSQTSLNVLSLIQDPLKDYLFGKITYKQICAESEILVHAHRIA